MKEKQTPVTLLLQIREALQLLVMPATETNCAVMTGVFQSIDLILETVKEGETENV